MQRISNVLKPFRQANARHDWMEFLLLLAFIALAAAAVFRSIGSVTPGAQRAIRTVETDAALVTLDASWVAEHDLGLLANHKIKRLREYEPVLPQSHTAVSGGDDDSPF